MLDIDGRADTPNSVIRLSVSGWEVEMRHIDQGSDVAEAEYPVCTEGDIANLLCVVRSGNTKVDRHRGQIR